MFRRTIFAVASAVAFACTAWAHEAHHNASAPAPFAVPPPPSREQVDTALERLRNARVKAPSEAERAKIDRGIAQLEAYKACGYDANEMLRRQKTQRKPTTKKTARPASGSALQPPLKGGVWKPSVQKRR